MSEIYQHFLIRPLLAGVVISACIFLAKRFYKEKEKAAAFLLVLIMIGAIMNWIAPFANGGKMPVWVIDQHSRKYLGNLFEEKMPWYILASNQTHLNILGDIFLIPTAPDRIVIVSAGDIIYYPSAACLLIIMLYSKIKEYRLKRRCQRERR